MYTVPQTFNICGLHSNLEVQCMNYIIFSFVNQCSIHLIRFTVLSHEVASFSQWLFFHFLSTVIIMSNQTYVIATWNIAGILNDTKQAIIKDVIITYNIDILCLEECSFLEFNLQNYTFINNVSVETKRTVAIYIYK